MRKIDICQDAEKSEDVANYSVFYRCVLIYVNKGVEFYAFSVAKFGWYAKSGVPLHQKKKHSVVSFSLRLKKSF